jgi:hypothetical protein
MPEQQNAAIAELQSYLADLERQAAETKQVINGLCKRAGMDPLYPDTAQATSAAVGALRSDSFYGKPMTSAAREYLEMRRAAGLGPATPREIFEALEKGGYTFETKDETTAIISVRGTIRKSSSIFHRLPNGAYGLLSWYPAARPNKDDDEDNARPPARRARKQKAARTTGSKAQAKAKSSTKGAPKTTKAEPREAVMNAEPEAATKAERIREELKLFLANGPKERSKILEHMKAQGLLGHEKDPAANLSAYLSRWRDLVVSAKGGKWELVEPAAKQAA